MVASSAFRLYPAAVWVFVLVIVFATEYAVMLVLPWVVTGQSSALLEATVDAVTLTAVLAPIIWGVVVKPLQEVVRLRTRFLSDLFAQIEVDRRRTAYELHDGVGQSLSLLVSVLRSTQDTVADHEKPTRRERSLRLAESALKDVKRVALGLRPSLLDDLGLAPAIERLVSDVREHSVLDVKLDASQIEGIRLDDAIETGVFRIVQEALANAITHAKARCATVTMHRRDGTLTVEVDDDGCGFDSQRGSASGHLGLIGMQERAALLGGQLTVHSELGRGTRIAASIPFRERNNG
jgi:signal transduction histidine kinase